MKTYIYTLKCLTNLHVGNGDVNYNIIDNEVEKDPVTNYPTINSSGVKGALRQYFEQIKSNATTALFGSAAGSSSENTKPGKLKIMQANMLARPVRASKGSEAFYMATTKTALLQFEKSALQLAGISAVSANGLDSTLNYRSVDETIALEGRPVETKLEDGNIKADLAKIIGSNFAILSNSTFRKFPLPVVARNFLDNGKSQNLWYEELVPHETVFWFAVMGDDSDLTAFDSAVNGKVVQFGGNASIGCGQCLISKLEG